MNFLRILVIIGVLLLVMMPVWPDNFKSVILYFNIGLLYALVFIMILRVIIYFLIRVFGYSIWLFPNFLEDVKF
jgi:hypothetical protein